MPIRLATWNFLHGGSARRSGHLARLLTETSADVVFSQEARPAPGTEEEIAGGAAPGGLAPGSLAAGDATAGDPHRSVISHFWHPVPGHRWGTGLWVRGIPAGEVEVPGFEGWVTGAELALPRRTRMFSVHCPSGAGGYVRSVHRILDAVATLADGADLVLAGDFNVATGYRGAADLRTMTRGERALLDRMGDEFGLVACWQAMHPDVPLAQTLRWMTERTAPYHCDGIFVPGAWRPLLTRCEILCGDEWERLSDHNPVVAEVAMVLPAETDGGTGRGSAADSGTEVGWSS